MAAEVEMSDQELITGLEEAVVAAPGNIPLRLHLVDHLITSGRPAEALAHSEAILRAQPDNVRAAEMAARSAEASEDMRASSFARLARALQVASMSAAAQPAQVPPPPGIPILFGIPNLVTIGPLSGPGT